MKVGLIDNMGNDLSVIRAAKASFAKDPVEWDEQEHPRLINYLARGMTEQDYQILITDIASNGHKYFQTDIDDDTHRDIVKDLVEQYRHNPTHWSPFAHTAITLRLKAPIAIHAQMMKHTVGFAHNTVSRRYVSGMPELFVPDFREAPKGNVKQGSGDLITKVEPYSIHEENGEKFRINYSSQTQESIKGMYRNICAKALVLYDEMIRPVDEGGLGIAPEQARFILPQGVMTEWVSTGSLYAWARFYNQRTDPHAQKEIQDLAKLVGEIIEPLYPVSWKALTR